MTNGAMREDFSSRKVRCDPSTLDARADRRAPIEIQLALGDYLSVLKPSPSQVESNRFRIRKSAVSLLNDASSKSARDVRNARGRISKPLESLLL